MAIVQPEFVQSASVLTYGWSTQARDITVRGSRARPELLDLLACLHPSVRDVESFGCMVRWKDQDESFFVAWDGCEDADSPMAGSETERLLFGWPSPVRLASSSVVMEERWR